MIMDYTHIDLTNYHVADLNAIQRKAAAMQAEELTRLASTIATSVKNLFSFGFMRHA
jgi:hypothetical protein